MDLKKYEEIFSRESEKYLDELDDALIEIEKDLLNQPLWGDIHGKIHSIKGMARALSMEKISGLCHSMEEWCKLFQEDPHKSCEESVQLLLDGTQILRTLVSEKGNIRLPDHLKQYDALTNRFSRGPGEPDEVKTDEAKPDQMKSVLARTIHAPKRIGHVRVEYALIEELMGYSQEIIQLEKRLPLMTREDVSSGVKVWVDHYMSVLKELYFRLTKLRLIPIDDFASLFRKTLRDLSKNYAREINFEVAGGDLQVDIALMDRLREPFIHILRNAIAHGIEPPEERAASGKAREGKIVLEAERIGDSLVLKITDDGRGINRSAITEYLKQKRSMSEKEISRMSEEAFCNTILNLDFSSAGHTDEMAGRGVGMNVVAQAIEYLNGSMSIRSQVSKGTQLIIKLPLSLSLVYAVTFRLGRYTLSIPTTHVEAIKGVVTTAKEEMDTPDCMRRLLSIEGDRGRASHLIELKHPGSLEVPSQALQFAVDAIVGNRPLMVMPVGELLAKTDFFAGVGIMENGGISVLLDTKKMLPRLTQVEKKTEVN